MAERRSEWPVLHQWDSSSDEICEYYLYVDLLL